LFSTPPVAAVTCTTETGNTNPSAGRAKVNVLLSAVNATLTYTYITEASVSVLTADNKTLTFARPAEGFVLPVSVVQVTAATGGVENNLIALE
jgi:hypothetical protein